MAHSVWILVKESKLPEVTALAEQLESSQYPMWIDTDWNWLGQSGWLPMTWQDRETGCEVDVEPLPKEESEAAAAAGYVDLDTGVVVTTRGWDGLRVGVSFCATIAAMTGGCVSEGDGEFVPHTETDHWARDVIGSADKLEAQDTAREETRKASLAAGDEERQIQEELDQYAGNEAVFLVVFDTVSVGLSGTRRVGGCNWRLYSGDQCFDHTKSRTLLHESVKLWHELPADFNWNTDEMPEHIAKKMEDLRIARENAEDEEEVTLEAAIQTIETWPDDLIIERAVWKPPHFVDVTFVGDTLRRLEFIGGSQETTFDIRTENLTFYIWDRILTR